MGRIRKRLTEFAAFIDQTRTLVAERVQTVREREIFSADEPTPWKIAEIGSDHAQLSQRLLDQNIASSIIAIEKTSQPLANSRRGLQGYSAVCRLADGLEGLEPGEVDAIVIAGQGGKSASRILSRLPGRLAPVVCVQCNGDAKYVRKWAIEFRYELVDEAIVTEHWRYPQMAFVYSPKTWMRPYEQIEMEVALEFGPILLSRRDDQLGDELRENRAWYGAKSRNEPWAMRPLKLVESALKHFEKLSES